MVDCAWVVQVVWSGFHYTHTYIVLYSLSQKQQNFNMNVYPMFVLENRAILKLILMFWETKNSKTVSWLLGFLPFCMGLEAGKT